MTDPSREVDIDALWPSIEEAAEAEVAEQQAESAHYEEMLADHDAAEAAATATIAPAPPQATEPPVPEKADEQDPPPVDRLVALIFASKSDGIPHVVTRLGTNVFCICKAAKFNSAHGGCWAMVAARTIWGIVWPEYGEFRYDR